jgi:3-methyladenine DNA glycosylase/8-oxoguanine DNA glycosylase
MDAHRAPDRPRYDERVTTEPPRETMVRPRLPVNVAGSLAPLRNGSGDPTTRRERDGTFWRASLTPDGPVTTRLRAVGDEVHVVAWGPGAEWALAAAPELLGCRDSVDDFAYERHPVVRDLHRARPGIRIIRSRAVFELAVPTIVHQKVIGGQARDSYRALVRRFGEPAPGPAGLLLPPSARTLAGLPYHAFHPFGIEMKRANSVRIAAVHAAKLDAMADLDPAVARERLTAIPGIGP